LQIFWVDRNTERRFPLQARRDWVVPSRIVHLYLLFSPYV
jgi:hypothetical protein